MKSKKKTKIICTIGQSSNNPAIIKKLTEKGMDVARIDTTNYNEKNTLEMIKNIRGASLNIPILIDIHEPKLNKSWIKFALKNDLDFVAIYAKSAEDIRNMNKTLGYTDIKQVIGEKIKVLARITKESLRNYKEIIEEAYGVIIDRNKLMSITKIGELPKLQKEIINECNKHCKPIITSGNILNSMIRSEQPQQHEVYDISNIVLDGASCIMLSKETELGEYPIKTLEIISSIVKNAETVKIDAHDIENSNCDLTHFIGKTASQLEKIMRIDALLIITSGGYSARMVSSRRLRCKTIAATSSKKIFRQLNLLWGIEPLQVNIDTEDISNNEKKEVILKALKKGVVGKRDQIAIIASIFHSKSKRTNLFEIHNVSEFLDYLNKNKELDLKV